MSEFLAPALNVNHPNPEALQSKYKEPGWLPPNHLAQDTRRLAVAVKHLLQPRNEKSKFTLEAFREQDYSSGHALTRLISLVFINKRNNQPINLLHILQNPPHNPTDFNPYKQFDHSDPNRQLLLDLDKLGPYTKDFEAGLALDVITLSPMTAWQPGDSKTKTLSQYFEDPTRIHFFIRLSSIPIIHPNPSTPICQII